MFDPHAALLAPDVPERFLAKYRKGNFRLISPESHPASSLPERLITDMTFRRDRSGRASPEDNPDIPAGYTYFGQFVAHDLSAHLSTAASRSPSLELNTLYGSGPGSNTYLYQFQPDRADRYTFVGVRFRLEKYQARNGENRELGEVWDVPRISTGRNGRGPRYHPLMGDTRNDQNFILSQLHVAWLRFHNVLAEYLRRRHPELEPTELFRRTRRLVILHYQWLVLQDYLKKLLGAPRFNVLRSLLADRQIDHFLVFDPARRPYLMPEFTSAAFRLGHSQVRSSYKIHLQDGMGRWPLFLRKDPAGSRARPNDLRGFIRNKKRAMDWRLFFRYPGSDQDLEKSKAFDRFIVPELSDLIFRPSRSEAKNLAKLDDKRACARLASAEAFKDAYCPGGCGLPAWPENWNPGAGASLWAYLLYEAEKSGEQPDAILAAADSAPENKLSEETARPPVGRTLGPLGGQIVAEQIFWVLRHGEISVLDGDEWIAESPLRGLLEAKTFSMADLLQFAGYRYAPPEVESAAIT